MSYDADADVDTVGKDWKWYDQDGGHGCIGEVIEVEVGSDKTWVSVRWRNGEVHPYRWGTRGCKFDLAIAEVTLLSGETVHSHRSPTFASIIDHYLLVVSPSLPQQWQRDEEEEYTIEGKIDFTATASVVSTKEENEVTVVSKHHEPLSPPDEPYCKFQSVLDPEEWCVESVDVPLVDVSSYVDEYSITRQSINRSLFASASEAPPTTQSNDFNVKPTVDNMNESESTFGHYETPSESRIEDDDIANNAQPLQSHPSAQSPLTVEHTVSSQSSSAKDLDSLNASETETGKIFRSSTRLEEQASRERLDSEYADEDYIGRTSSDNIAQSGGHFRTETFALDAVLTSLETIVSQTPPRKLLKKNSAQRLMSKCATDSKVDRRKSVPLTEGYNNNTHYQRSCQSFLKTAIDSSEDDSDSRTVDVDVDSNNNNNNNDIITVVDRVDNNNINNNNKGDIKVIPTNPLQRRHSELMQFQHRKELTSHPSMPPLQFRGRRHSASSASDYLDSVEYPINSPEWLLAVKDRLSEAAEERKVHDERVRRLVENLNDSNVKRRKLAQLATAEAIELRAKEEASTRVAAIKAKRAGDCSPVELAHCSVKEVKLFRFGSSGNVAVSTSSLGVRDVPSPGSSSGSATQVEQNQNKSDSLQRDGVTIPIASASFDDAEFFSGKFYTPIKSKRSSLGSSLSLSPSSSPVTSPHHNRSHKKSPARTPVSSSLSALIRQATRTQELGLRPIEFDSSSPSPPTLTRAHEDRGSFIRLDELELKNSSNESIATNDNNAQQSDIPMYLNLPTVPSGTPTSQLTDENEVVMYDVTSADYYESDGEDHEDCKSVSESIADGGTGSICIPKDKKSEGGTSSPNSSYVSWKSYEEIIFVQDEFGQIEVASQEQPIPAEKSDIRNNRKAKHAQFKHRRKSEPPDLSSVSGNRSRGTSRSDSFVYQKWVRENSTESDLS